MPVSRGLVNACEPEVSADVVVLTNWLIAVETSPVVQQNPVAIRKWPFSILLPPTSQRDPQQRETGSPSPNVSRPTDCLISNGGKLYAD